MSLPPALSGRAIGLKPLPVQAPASSRLKSPRIPPGKLSGRELRRLKMSRRRSFEREPLEAPLFRRGRWISSNRSARSEELFPALLISGDRVRQKIRHRAIGAYVTARPQSRRFFARSHEGLRILRRDRLPLPEEGAVAGGSCFMTVSMHHQNTPRPRTAPRPLGSVAHAAPPPNAGYHPAPSALPAWPPIRAASLNPGSSVEPFARIEAG